MVRLDAIRRATIADGRYDLHMALCHVGGITTGAGDVGQDGGTTQSGQLHFDTSLAMDSICPDNLLGGIGFELVVDE